MVKVFVLFLALFTLTNNINAETYYGEYYKVKSIDNLNKDEYLIVKDIYFKRDKLVLKDNIEINNSNTKIIDFIEYSSGNVMLDYNIKYNINGLYYCIFKLNDIIVKKDVLVNIDNYIKQENNIIKLASNKEVKIVKKNNNYKKYIKVIIFIILISVDIVLSLKKKKKKFCRNSLKSKKN